MYTEAPVWTKTNYHLSRKTEAHSLSGRLVLFWIMIYGQKQTSLERIYIWLQNAILRFYIFSTFQSETFRDTKSLTFLSRLLGNRDIALKSFKNYRCYNSLQLHEAFSARRQSKKYSVREETIELLEARIGYIKCIIIEEGNNGTVQD